jgi:hypothetical protein
MKKVSTAAAKQSRNFLQSNLTIGLIWAIAPAAIAFWMKPEALSWNRKFPPRLRVCKRHWQACRVAGSLWNRDALAVGKPATERASEERPFGYMSHIAMFGN